MVGKVCQDVALPVSGAYEVPRAVQHLVSVPGGAEEIFHVMAGVWRHLPASLHVVLLRPAP